MLWAKFHRSVYRAVVRTHINARARKNVKINWWQQCIFTVSRSISYLLFTLFPNLSLRHTFLFLRISRFSVCVYLCDSLSWSIVYFGICFPVCVNCLTWPILCLEPNKFCVCVDVAIRQNRELVINPKWWFRWYAEFFRQMYRWVVRRFCSSLTICISFLSSHLWAVNKSECFCVGKYRNDGTQKKWLCLTLITRWNQSACKRVEEVSNHKSYTSLIPLNFLG